MTARRRLIAVAAAIWVVPAAVGAAPRSGPIFVPPQERESPTPKKPDHDKNEAQEPGKSTPKKSDATPSDPDVCRDAVVQTDEGIVSVDLANMRLVGKTIDYRLGRFTTSAVADSSGHARLLAPLFAPTGKIEWNVAGGRACDRDVTFSNYQNAFVFAISWVEPQDAALELDLHAVEPRSAIGAPSGYVSRTHPLGDALTQGIFRSFGNSGPGAMHFQYYSVPTFRRPGGGVFTFRVQFTSRGNPAVPPYCKGHPHARVSFRYYELSRGELGDRGQSFGPRECGSAFTDSVQGFASFDMKP